MGKRGVEMADTVLTVESRAERADSCKGTKEKGAETVGSIMLTWALVAHGRQVQGDFDPRNGRQEEHVAMAPGAEGVQCIGDRGGGEFRINTGPGGGGQTGVWRQWHLRCREGTEEQGYTEVLAERAGGERGQAQQQTGQT
ncbi:hypothetical protein NDU88_001715 [Pleurodeles waltl]|uniref:Uncharacterized protein n=1 Tax=Pleurodeles waltl TaxID=8319 RepID=A0AAV7VYF7_PLEWA|nr:hypothetical protein NDU88_001715 [Pleurodeles waltl]